MEELKKIGTEVPKELARVVGCLGKHYLSSIIANALKPKLEASFKKLIEGAKEAADEKAGKVKADDGELLDSFPFEAKGVAEPDMFKCEIDSCPIIRPYRANDYVSYDVACVRIGKKAKGLMVLGCMYHIRYNQWINLQEKLQKENKDAKLPPIPPEQLLGTYCGCLSRSWDPSHQTNMKKWVLDIQAVVGMGSKALADHFYMGDDYKNQRMWKKVFDTAYAAAARELGLNDPWGDLPPFDEGEAVVTLCQKYLVDKFLPKIINALPESPLKYRLEWTAAGTAYALVDAAISAGWPPIQAGINEAKSGIAKVIEEGGQKLVDAVQPVLEKVFNAINEKMPKDEKADAPEEDKESKEGPGGVVKAWKFEKTQIGGAFFAELVEKDSWNDKGSAAVQRLGNGWTGAMKSFMDEKLTKGITDCCNPRFASSGIVRLIVEKFAGYITRVIDKFTTVQPLIDATVAFDKKRWDLEAALVKAKEGKGDLGKTVDEYSGHMWQLLPDAGLLLFIKLDSIKASIRNEYRGKEFLAGVTLSRESVEGLTSVADHMFHIQMRALNALRVKFGEAVKEKVNAAADAKGVEAAVRQTWRDVMFGYIPQIVSEGWEKTREALNDAAFQFTCDFFFQKIWPAVTEPLSKLQEMMPGPLAKLDILSLAQTLVEKLIEKGVNSAFGKMFDKLEKALFAQ